MHRAILSHFLAPNWSVNQLKLHTCEGATHCFISHALGFSWVERGKMQISPGSLSADVTIAPTSYSISGVHTVLLAPDDGFGHIFTEENSIR